MEKDARRCRRVRAGEIEQCHTDGFLRERYDLQVASSKRWPNGPLLSLRLASATSVVSWSFRTIARPVNSLYSQCHWRRSSRSASMWPT